MVKLRPLNKTMIFEPMKPAFNVKSAHLDALSIQLQTVEIDEISETLQNQIGKYLKFKSLPFILDARQIEDGHSLPFSDILALFALHELKIIALRHSDASWEAYAKQHNLVFIAEKTIASTELDNTENQDTANTPTEEHPSNSESETAPHNTHDSDNILGDAEAFARELFGEHETTKSNETNNETTATNATPDNADDILLNDNDAIKTVEMAKQADLVELSPEEARRIAQETPSELSGQVGEAKGEIVSISEAKQTIVVSTPVRTGQQIYAEKADLIVLGIVSPGAEVIADGNIHIYAPLRGRALAGASGDRKARIFVQSMQAELVSIAGIYRTFEQKLPQHLHKQPVRIELQDDRLAISSIVTE